MSYFNHVTLIGNVGSAPEVLKKNEKGTFVRFSIAINKQFTHEGKTVKKTEWYKVVANNGVGTFIADHLKKGMRVFVFGELNHDKWTDQNNQERKTIYISASSVDFLGALNKTKSQKNETDKATAEIETSEVFGDE